MRHLVAKHAMKNESPHCLLIGGIATRQAGSIDDQDTRNYDMEIVSAVCQSSAA